VGSMIQVKTRISGKDKGWHMRKKHEDLVHPRLFYTFVDLAPASPVVYVIPSRIVAVVMKLSHETWLALPGKGGRKHRDTVMRRLLPRYPFPIAGYPDGWLDNFKERWGPLVPSGLITSPSLKGWSGNG